MNGRPVAEALPNGSAPPADAAAATAPAVALARTQYGAWYPALRRHAPKSTVLDVESIEPGFVAWLESDGLFLPRGSDTAPQRHGNEDEAEAMSLPSDDDEEPEEAPEFPALNAKLREVIEEYDGAVFPKLNWSAPLDASWIMPGNTLRCQTPGDVYLLLKSSDFTMKDVAQVRELAAAAEGSAAPRLQLVLKKWFDMPKAHEFRCFVRHGMLVAACQRDVTFYEHLQPAEVQERIRAQLHAFFEAHLRPAPDDPLQDFAFDVYLTRQLDRCFLIDLAPWLPRTDPLLWTFDEVDEAVRAAHTHGAPERVPLRVLTSPAQATQSQPTYSSNMIPSDVVELGSGHSVAEFAQRWASEVAAAAHGSDEEDA